MAVVVLLFTVLFLLDSYEAKDSSSVIPVFVQTGTDLLLDVKEPVTLNEDSDFLWKYNGAKTIVKISSTNKTTIYKKEKAAVFGNYSLLLKNVQQKDSAMYKAQIAAEEEEIVAEYKVTVQDPVSPVNLTVNCSSAPNFTVTCRTVDSHISSTFRCDNQTCSQERLDPTTYPSSIDVYLDQGFIICNHSNHVSQEHKKEEIKTFCPSSPVTASPVNWTAIGIRLAVIGTIVICSPLIIKYMLQKNSTRSSSGHQWDTPSE